MHLNLFRIREFARDERGASYSISVLLILPFYLISIMFAIELVFALNAELALTASEESAVHAVKCWYPHRDAIGRDGASLEEEIHRAVVRVMVPFAPVGLPSSERDRSLDTALHASGLSAKAVERYGAKYAALQKLVGVRVMPVQQPNGRGSTSGFEVVLQYEAPLFFDFFAPILANGSNAYGPVRMHESKIFVAVSQRQLETTQLGIPYSPREAMQW